MKRCFYSSVLILIIGFSLGMGFVFEGLVGQQKQTPAQQLQQAKQIIAKQNIIIADIKAERNQAIVEIANLRKDRADQRAGIMKTEKLLQKAINNDEKIDYYELILMGWDIVLPDSTKGSKKPAGKSLQ